MKQLHPDQYENVRPLFHVNYPNLPMIYGIIECLIPGQIWVDKENEPSVCLVMTGATYCFIAGNLNAEIFQDFLQLLKQKELVKLAFETDAPLEPSTFGFIPVARRQYRYKNIQSKLPMYENDSGYILKKIEDEETFDLCIWKPLIISIFGDTENYLKNGMGFILWDAQKGVVASEAHGILSNKYVEVGTVTHEDYRGRKLSTILCNHLIHYAIKKDLQPVWSCDEANLISWKVAEKQGMDELIKYTFHTLNQSKGA